MELKPQTLILAIQSLETVTKHLDQNLKNENVPNPAEAEQLLVSYEVAAMDLRAYYEEMSPQYGDMPSYDDLIAEVS